MDRYNIDNHKLMYHPARVASWLNHDPIVPIYIEISPTGACNHSCSFCGLDFLNYKTHKLDPKALAKSFKIMSVLGVKSIMIAGEGEPLLHPDIAEIIMSAYKCGLDVAVTTNGSLLSLKLARAILPYLTWLRISINGATRATYKQIHGHDHFEDVCNNIQAAKNLETPCTIGMQFIVLPENEYEIEEICDLAIDLGADYLAFKPFSQHPQMENKKYKTLVYKQEILNGIKHMKKANPNFDIIYREQAFLECNSQAKTTSLCYAMPFWSYIDSKGDVWSCSVWIGDKRFYRGNINTDNTFDILAKRRPDCFGFPANDCRINCRMTRANEYLANLQNGVIHENFI